MSKSKVYYSRDGSCTILVPVTENGKKVFEKDEVGSYIRYNGRLVQLNLPIEFKTLVPCGDKSASMYQPDEDTEQFVYDYLDNMVKTNQLMDEDAYHKYRDAALYEAREKAKSEFGQELANKNKMIADLQAKLEQQAKRKG